MKIKGILVFGIFLLSAAVFGGISYDTSYKRVRLIQNTLPKTVMVYAQFRVKRVVIRVEENMLVFKEIEAPVTVRGSGVFISGFGHILTAAHLLDVSTTSLGVQVATFDGKYYPAEVVHISKDVDLALLKVSLPKQAVYARIVNPKALRVGQEVISIGNPLGSTFTVTHGIISRLNVDMREGYSFTQSDASMNPGNSGGPLFNLAGDLVGINSRIIPPVNLPIFTGLGFAVSPEAMKAYLALFRGIREN